MQPEVDAGRASVVVVDNCSTDGSREAVRSEYPWAELMEPSENLGFGAGVNAAAARTGGTWLAAANADIELTPGALEAMIEASEADPSVGAIAPRLIMGDGATQHSVHSFPSPSLALTVGLGLHRVSRAFADRLCIEGSWDADRARRVDWAHGAFLLLRRESFEQVGGFDERQWMYAEDIDLAWRLAEMGHAVRYEPGARVRHAVSASTLQAFGEDGREQRHIAAAYDWLERRRGRAVARLTAAISTLAAGVRFAVFAPLGRIAPRRWGAARERARRYVSAHRLGLRSRGHTT